MKTEERQAKLKAIERMEKKSLKKYQLLDLSLVKLQMLKDEMLKDKSFNLLNKYRELQRKNLIPQSKSSIESYQLKSLSRWTSYRLLLRLCERKGN